MRWRGFEVKGRAVIVLLIALTVVLGCAKNAQILRENLAEQGAPRGEKEEELAIPYGDIDLEITAIYQVEPQQGLYNSYNPKFTTDERYLAYEVYVGTQNKIYIYELDEKGLREDPRPHYKRVKEVFLGESFEGELSDEFFEGFHEESFNYEFTWFPSSSTFLFTSNAGVGKYNIYAGAVLENDDVLQNMRRNLKLKQLDGYYMLTEEFRKDGQAKVSPDGTRVVFTSGRSGRGDLYLFDLVTAELKQLTDNPQTDLFPQWSPDGRDIVFTTGGKTSHDIHVIRNAGLEGQREDVLVSWFFDDVLPTYSPDGKSIAFYTTYNRERDPFNTKRWGIMIIPADGSGPQAGEELVGYFHVPDVIKDNSQGTAWFPDSEHIIYAKNIDSEYNPIYIYNVVNRTERFVDTGTDINHDLTVSPHGLVSFRAQWLGWDRIFVASSTYFQEYVNEVLTR
jgi:hypothetical protein